MMTTLMRAIMAHWQRWLIYIVTFVLAYQLLLIAALVLRFGALPNYVESYDLITNYQLIIAGSPDWMDTLHLLMIEPWLEVGYKNPDYYGISEWSLMILPGKLAVITLTSLLLSTSILLTAKAKTLPCPTGARSTALGITGASTALLAVTNATVTWVVCCATPTWVVMLSMMGLSSSIALSLEPLGIAAGSVAFLLMLAVIFYQTLSIHRRLIPHQE